MKEIRGLSILPADNGTETSNLLKLSKPVFASFLHSYAI